jgi:ArsR family transcriptional regulator, zinc-responsive transcriptional repressor
VNVAEPALARRQRPPHPENLRVAAELLKALGAPHRLAIVLELASGPRCVHELVKALGISQSLTSQHLRVLRAGRLVRGVRRGKEMAYSLADAHAAHIARDAMTYGNEPKHLVGDGTGSTEARSSKPPTDVRMGEEGSRMTSGTEH